VGADWGPCEPWPVIWACTVPADSAAVTGAAVEAATYVAWSLSGRQFGTCPVTIRPCRRDCADIPPGWSPFPPAAPYPTPALIAGQWYNLTCGCSLGDCSCTSLDGREVVLPAPVSAVTSVKVDGSPLVTGAYRVDDDRILVRVDGQQWPSCNDLTKADTQAGTWSVTADYGQPVPTAGQLAVGDLACEILRAIRGDDCRLPRGVQQLVRQGVSITMPAVTDLLTKGAGTGIYLLDLFVRAANPAGLPSRSRAFNVDGPSPRRAGT